MASYPLLNRGETMRTICILTFSQPEEPAAVTPAHAREWPDQAVSCWKVNLAAETVSCWTGACTVHCPGQLGGKPVSCWTCPYCPDQKGVKLQAVEEEHSVQVSWVVKLSAVEAVSCWSSKRGISVAKPAHVQSGEAVSCQTGACPSYSGQVNLTAEIISCWSCACAWLSTKPATVTYCGKG